MAMKDHKPRVLFFFPHPAESEVGRIRAGEIPSERLYGAIELQARGWQVDYADRRFAGSAGRMHARTGQIGINFVDPATLRSLRQYDCIVAKDSFSTMLSAAAKLAGVPIVYLDAMFVLPTSWRRRWSARINMGVADRIVCYSRTQARIWAESFGLADERFEVLPYCIDLDFYRQRRRDAPLDSRILAVGRDLGRDFPTLARAVRDTDLTLTLVTLPYLLSDEIRRQPNVDIVEHIPYDNLFDLYARASCVVVPLKGSVTYPSGIRAVMESLALGKSTVATESPVLREYFAEASGVSYVPADAPEALRRELISIVGDAGRRTRMESLAGPAISSFDLTAFVDPFEDLLIRTIKDSAQ